jgi:hypothetical protein
MTPPAARRRSQFIDAMIDEYAAAHSTPPDAHQLELQHITRDKTGRAAGMQIGDDQALLSPRRSGHASGRQFDGIGWASAGRPPGGPGDRTRRHPAGEAPPPRSENHNGGERAAARGMGRGCAVSYFFLTASLTFSPACLRSPLT